MEFIERCLLSDAEAQQRMRNAPAFRRMHIDYSQYACEAAGSEEARREAKRLAAWREILDCEN